MLTKSLTHKTKSFSLTYTDSHFYFCEIKWNPSAVPCPVLNVASWPAYRFLRREVRWSGIPISFRIFQFVVIHTNMEQWTGWEMLGKIEGGRRRGRQRMRLLDDITNSMDMREQTPWDGEGRGAWRAAVHGVTTSQTRLSHWKTRRIFLKRSYCKWIKKSLDGYLKLGK